MKSITPKSFSKSVYAFLIALCFSTATYAAAISALQTGDWNATTTWSGGAVPGVADDVTITGFTVTVSTAGALAQSITVQSDATVAGKLIVQSGATLTVSSGALNSITLKGGEVENAGSISLTTTAASCIAYSATNTSMLVTKGKYSGAGALSLDCSAAASGSAITMAQSQTIATTPTTYIGGVFTVGGTYTFNIASGRPIFRIDAGRPIIDGIGEITAGTLLSPVSHGLIMITTSFGNLTINSGVTLSIVSNMAVASRGPIYMHNIQYATLTNKGTINIKGTGTNGIGSIANGNPSSVTLTNEGAINIDGAFSESGIGINGALNASFNITNTGTITISGLSASVPALAIPNATNSNLTFTNNTNGVLDINAGNTGIVTGGLGSARLRLINSGGTLKGSGILNGAFEPSTGTVSPGGTGIGKITLAQLQATAVNTNNLTGNCMMNVNGKTTAGTDFDQLVFTQATVNVAGATLEAIVGGGYSPVFGDNVALFSTVAHTGNFSSTILPASSSLDYTAATAIGLTFGITGVEYNTAATVKIFSTNATITIENALNKALNIYSLEGKTIYSANVKSNNEVLNLQKGIYVVSIDNIRSKVVVR